MDPEMPVEEMSNEEQVKPTSSILGASLNFVNSIVGTGIVSIPFAFQKAGFLPGIILLILVATMIYNGVIMLIDCGIFYDIYDLEQLSEHTMGRFGYFLSVTSMLIFAFGAQVAYLVVIGDTVPMIIQVLLPNYSTSIFTSRSSIIYAVSTLIILPLCLLKHISTLSRVAFFSIMAVSLLVLLVVFHSPLEAKHQHIPSIDFNDYIFLRKTVFGGIGTLSFTFVCQHNSFIIFRSLTESTLRSWKRVAFSSISVACLLCLILGIGGYLSFLDNAQGNILNNFGISDHIVTFARLFLAINMMLTYPQEGIVSRHSLLSLVHRACASNEKLIAYVHDNLSPEATPLLERDRKSSCASQQYGSILSDMISIPEDANDSVLRVPVTVLLWMASVFIAVFFEDVGVVLEVTGTVAGSMIGYVIPAAIYIMRWNQVKAGDHWSTVLFPGFMLSFGLLSLFAGIITVIVTEIFS